MKIVSLFSGAGGLDLGFIMAGHQIIWANDLYKDAVDTYRRNIGDHIVLEDITNIPSSAIPDCDLVIGGFPCQGFSVANVKRHTDDKRNSLYKELLRVVTDKAPKFFMAENVKGLLSIGNGEVIKMIIKDFSDIGYKVQYRLFNTADFGVPQIRQRVIIVGVRNDITYDFCYPTPTHNRNGDAGLKKWKSVMDAIGHFPNPDEPNDYPNHEYSHYKMNMNGYIGHRPLQADLPSPTITARGDDKGGVVIHPHPNGERRMTCREVAAIQTFPDDFFFCGSKSSIYRQIGNAVPPLFAYSLAKQFPMETLDV